VLRAMIALAGKSLSPTALTGYQLSRGKNVECVLYGMCSVYNVRRMPLPRYQVSRGKNACARTRRTCD
jgi:hypothetical protein